MIGVFIWNQSGWQIRLFCWNSHIRRGRYLFLFALAFLDSHKMVFFLPTRLVLFHAEKKHFPLILHDGLVLGFSNKAPSWNGQKMQKIKQKSKYISEKNNLDTTIKLKCCPIHNLTHLLLEKIPC